MAEKIRPPTHSTILSPESQELKAKTEGELSDLVKMPDPGRTLDPDEAAAARAGHNHPNRLGKPFEPRQEERLLSEYQKALLAYRADYSGTRSERLKVPYLEAREACVAAGLMQPE